MKTHRGLERHKKTRKYKKGGGWFSNSSSVTPEQCNPNELTQLTTSNEMHEKYQKCCPKSFMGYKNSSPYCKQLDLNFQSAISNENNANEYKGVEQTEIDNVPNSKRKPWYKFWGGKKSKKHRKNKHKKSSRKLTSKRR